MNQIGLDFSKDVNQRKYTVEEHQLVVNLVIDYKEKKNSTQDNSILLQLFFEEYSIEIIDKLKADKYFEGNWSFEESDFGLQFYNFINSKTKFDDSCIIEFILILINTEEFNISPADWRENNEVKKLSFDRKITEGFIKLIVDNKLEKIIFPYIGYVKMWNYIRLYKSPFNNFKATLIHRLVAESLWPKKYLTYDNFADFELKICKIFQPINQKLIYKPFFDKENRAGESQQYITEKEKLSCNLNKLFDYDNTDENESYTYLIESLINNSSDDIKNKHRELIENKLTKLMYPYNADVDAFYKLYQEKDFKEYGKLLLSKFYCFDKIIY